MGILVKHTVSVDTAMRVPRHQVPVLKTVPALALVAQSRFNGKAKDWFAASVPRHHLLVFACSDILRASRETLQPPKFIKS